MSVTYTDITIEVPTGVPGGLLFSDIEIGEYFYLPSGSAVSFNPKTHVVFLKVSKTKAVDISDGFPVTVRVGEAVGRLPVGTKITIEVTD